MGSEDARYRVLMNPPLKPGKGALTQEKILRGAIPVIAERGLHSVKYDDIAKASGTTRTLVQTYFPDRDALFSGCVGLARREFQAAVVQALQNAPPTADRLRVYVESTLDWIAKHRAEASLFVLFHHFAIHNESMRKLSQEQAEVGRSRIEALLKENPRFRGRRVAHRQISKAIQNALMGNLYAFATENGTLKEAKKLMRASMKALLQTYLEKAIFLIGFLFSSFSYADIHLDALGANGLNLFCQGVSKNVVLGAGESLSAAGICFDGFELTESPLFLTGTWESVLEYHQVLATRVYKRNGYRITVKEFEKRLGPPPDLALALNLAPRPSETHRFGEYLSLAAALQADVEATQFVQKFMAERNQSVWNHYTHYLSGFLDDAIGHYARRDWSEVRKQGFRMITLPFAIRSRTIDVVREGDQLRVGTFLLVRAPFGRRREILVTKANGHEEVIRDETGRWGQLYAQVLSPNPYDVLQHPGYFYKPLSPNEGPPSLPLESYFGAVPRVGVVTLREVIEETKETIRLVEWREGEVIEPRLFTQHKTENTKVMAELYTQLLDFLLDPRLSLSFNCHARDHYTCNDRPRLYDPRYGFKTESVQKELDGKIWHRLHASGADLLRNARVLGQALTERDEVCLAAVVHGFQTAFGLSD